MPRDRARARAKAAALVALVKPQFEVGREQASRGKGVIRDEAVRAEAIERARTRRRAIGVRGRARSATARCRDPRATVEAFVHARRA